MFQQEEISEQQVRISLLERKLENAMRDSNEQVDKMKRKLDDALIQFKKKEKCVLFIGSHFSF